MRIEIDIAQLTIPGVTPKCQLPSGKKLINLTINSQTPTLVDGDLSKVVLENLLSLIRFFKNQNKDLHIQEVCFEGSIDLSQSERLILQIFCSTIGREGSTFRHINGTYSLRLIEALLYIANTDRMTIDIGDLRSPRAKIIGDVEEIISALDRSRYMGNFSGVPASDKSEYLPENVEDDDDQDEVLHSRAVAKEQKRKKAALLMQKIPQLKNTEQQNRKLID